MKKNKFRPKRIKIGALIYKVKYVTPGRHELLNENESGAIDQERQIILIDKHLSEQMTIMVIMHEILHGVGDAMHPNRSPFTKEKFTCTVTELLVPALQSAGLLPS